MPFNHFDIIAGLYNRMAKYNLPEHLLESFALTPDCKLLDVGGGTGRVADVLQRRVKVVIVADISRGMLRYAADKRLPVANSPAEYLPFASSSFDRIIMVDALHHVHDQRQTISELWRVLSPGGRIIIIEPDINKFAVKLMAFGEKILLMDSHFLTGDNITALFIDNDKRSKIFDYESDVWVYTEKEKKT